MDARLLARILKQRRELRSHDHWSRRHLSIVERSERRFEIKITRLYDELATALGVPEFTPVVCQIDNAAFNSYLPDRVYSWSTWAAYRGWRGGMQLRMERGRLRFVCARRIGDARRRIASHQRYQHSNRNRHREVRGQSRQRRKDAKFEDEPDAERCCFHGGALPCWKA